MLTLFHFKKVGLLHNYVRTGVGAAGTGLNFYLKPHINDAAAQLINFNYLRLWLPYKVQVEGCSPGTLILFEVVQAQ
jgi:hypothetical protein